MSFKHLTAEDRSVIATLLGEQRSNNYIARRLGVNLATIGREIKRNQMTSPSPIQDEPPRPAILAIDARHTRGSGLAQDKHEAAVNYARQIAAVRRRNQYYVGRTAHKHAVARRTTANQQRLRLVYNSRSWLERYVRRHLLKDQWSPEQMTGDLERNHQIIIYAQTIYDYIYLCPDKKRLVKHLRRGGNPYRHKHGTNARLKARAANLPSIHQRPEIVEARTRLGDLEGDTIVGLDYKDRIATHVDRTSGECLLALVLGYNACKITDTAVRVLADSPVPTHTITYDRGIEFSDYQRLGYQTKVDIYFADAYSSWQRGSNENLNGLVRQYYPKRSNFKDITPEQLKTVETKLNNRPRKRYNYRTPIQQREYVRRLERSSGVAVGDRM